MLTGEYENVYDVILTSGVKHESCQESLTIQQKVLSNYAPCMDNRTVIIEPCDISLDEKNKEIVSSSVMDFVWKNLADARAKPKL